MKGLSHFAIAALLTASVAPAAFAQQPAVHQEPYEEFYSELVRFYDKKERDRLVLRTTLLAQDGKTLIDPIRIRIATREGVTDVPVTTDNEFMMPFNPAWVKEGAMVEINQPEKNYRIRANSATEFSGCGAADFRPASEQGFTGSGGRGPPRAERPVAPLPRAPSARGLQHA